MDSPRETQRLARLAPLSEIFERLDAIARPVAGMQMGVDAAAGRVLAADVEVTSPLPPVRVALRDGWATQSELIWDAGPYAPAPIVPAPQWVEAGDPLPEGCDAVLPAEAVSLVSGAAEAFAPAAPGEGAVAASEEVQAGEVLRRKGERLRKADVAVLRAAGVTSVSVRAPNLRVVSAHPEIDAASDVASPLVTHMIETEGGRTHVGRAAENPDALKEALNDKSADAVIVIGGTGEGRRDASVLTLARMGRVDIHGMGVRPGETGALGIIGARPVLLLPGRLDAVLAVWLLIGRRLLGRLAGIDVTKGPAFPVTLTRKSVSTIGIADVVLLAHSEGGVEPIASGFFPLRAIARADGWMLVSPESEGFPPGSTIDMLPLP